MIDGLLGHQIGIAVIITTGIEYFKRLPFIDASIGSIRFFAAILATLASVGFAVSMDGTFQNGGHIIIVYPNWHQLAEFVLHLSTQLGLTEGAYRGIIKPVVGVTPPLKDLK